MRRNLHPGAIAAIVAVGVVAIGSLFFTSGGRNAAKSDNASPHTKIGEIPTSPGSGVNSLTGEPLPEKAKTYAADSLERLKGPNTSPR